MDAWHEYYTLAGTASATLVGLLFVAASVGSGVWEGPAALLLLVAGIRNAWDITVWIVTRRQS